MGVITASALLPSYLAAYDTHNCPVQPILCGTLTNATLAPPDCKNGFGVLVHIFSFVATGDETVSLFVNIYPFELPIMSLYGPGDATPAVNAPLVGNADLSSTAINSYHITRAGTWNVAVTTIDNNAQYIVNMPFTLMLVCAADAPPPPTIKPRRRSARH